MAMQVVVAGLSKYRLEVIGSGRDLLIIIGRIVLSVRKSVADSDVVYEAVPELTGSNLKVVYKGTIIFERAACFKCWAWRRSVRCAKRARVQVMREDLRNKGVDVELWEKVDPPHRTRELAIKARGGLWLLWYNNGVLRISARQEFPAPENCLRLGLYWVSTPATAGNVKTPHPSRPLKNTERPCQA